MTAPQDHDGDLMEGGGTPAIIIRNKSRILDVFCERVQGALPGARASSHPVMIDTLPAFITRLALAMSPGHREIYASQYSNIAGDLEDANALRRNSPALSRLVWRKPRSVTASCTVRAFRASP